MNIIITDVTDMGGGHICVAGWSPDEGRMIRPLHGTGHPHWDEHLAQDGIFCPGNVISIIPSGHPPNRSFPHSAEDCLVIGTPKLSENLSEEMMVRAVAGSVHGSVLDLFGDDFTDKKYIPDKQGIRSLGAVEVTTRTIRFYEKPNKVVCWFVDSDNEKYTFTISCRALKATHLQSGTEGLDALKTRKRKAHIRLGLANAWDGQPDNNWNPKHCYAMVNGIFFV
ncbi:MAG: hypothetical protein HQ504_07090 [Rhodospirillaceae bacterium]|nr:hypothetical protein [Rhodospirillaceae bacterium]